MSSITMLFLAEPGTVNFGGKVRIGDAVEVQARRACTGNSTRAHHP